MSNNVLILDAGCQNYGKGGELNHYLSRIAEEELTKLGWNVEITLIDSQWETAAEAESRCHHCSNPGMVDEHALAAQAL